MSLQTEGLIGGLFILGLFLAVIVVLYRMRGRASRAPRLDRPPGQPRPWRWQRRWLYLPFSILCGLLQERLFPKAFLGGGQNDLWAMGTWLAGALVLTEIFVRAVPVPSPSTANAVRSGFGQLVALCLGGGCLAFLVYWVFIFVFASHALGPRLDQKVLDRAEPQLEMAVYETLNLATNDPHQFSMEHRAQGNVRIYVPRESWERVPFPQRDAAAKTIGQAWCRGLGKEANGFATVVSIRDIRSGEEMAYSRCP
jgi:hypothetical protein